MHSRTIMLGQWIFGLVLLAAVNGSLAQTAPSGATPGRGAAGSDDVPGLMSEQRYDEALKAIGRLLDPAHAGTVDRPATLMLRADCELQLKHREDAVRTLNQVKTEADKATDSATSDRALALLTLIGRSNNFMFTPGTLSDKTPLNILNPDTRKAAYTALLADEMAAIEKQRQSIQTNADLKPLTQIATNFTTVRAVERAASGATAQSDALAKELSKLAGQTIDTTLQKYSDQINTIADNAIKPSVPGSIVDPPGTKTKTPRSTPRGLSQEDMQQLRGIASDCQQIPKAIATFTSALGESDLPSRNGTASEVGIRANKCLDVDYAAAKGSIKTPARRSGRSSRNS